jgi:hypothetical protein
VKGLCDIPNGLTIISESIPMITRASTLKFQEGHGSLILNGEVSVNQ